MGADSWERLVVGWWRHAVSAVGALLLFVGVVSVLLDGQLGRDEALQIASLVVLCALLVGVGWQIARDVDETDEVLLVVGWMGLGVLVSALLGGWLQFVSATITTSFQATIVFLSPLAAGALVGAVVGYYDVRVRGLVERAGREAARREHVREQRESLSTLNAILRHQVLNDLSVISGQAELLALERVDGDEAADTILDHADHVVDVVDRIETISAALGRADDPAAVSVGTAIERALVDARRHHPDATFVLDGDADAAVLADHLLSLAIYEVLDNAATHGGAEPTVTVAVDDGGQVTVRVRDDGPGVSVSPPERAFEASERGIDSDGDGLGLFLAEAILDRYGGTIELIPDDDPTGGATFALRIPAA